MNRTFSDKIVLALILLCFNSGGQIAAQDLFTPNFSVAAHMGSGVYAMRDALSQIYRVSGSICLLSAHTHTWGIRARLTGAAGFFDYEWMDFFSEGLPRGISAVALFPTLEAEHLISPNWMIAPFVGLGAGVEIEERSHQWLAGGGLRNLWVFPAGAGDLRINSRLLYCGLLKKDLRPLDDFGMIESGIEFRRPLGIELFGLQLDGSIFGINYIYQVGPGLLVNAPKPTLRRTEGEIGFTLGFAESVCIWKVSLPRVGISYRFGSEREGIRIFAGDSFPIRSPRGEVVRRFNLLLRKQE